MIGPLLQRKLRVGKMFQHKFQARAGDVFECLNGVVMKSATQHQQLQRRVHRWNGTKSQGQIARSRHQFQDSGGDDAERTFGADEQLAEAVSGVIFPQAPEAVPDASIGQNDLQSQHLIARISVAKGIVSARIGGQNSANLRRPFRGHGQRQHAILGDGRFLRCLESDAGFDRHRQIHGVQFPDSVHPRKRQHKLSAVRAGRGADHHAGIAALRDNRDTPGGA